VQYMRTQLSALVVLTTAVASAAVLTGTVVEDHSNNPLALAGVRIVRISPHTVVAELDTDGQGKFETPDLPAAEYRLEIAKPNFLDTHIRIHLTNTPRNITARLVHRVAFSGLALDQQGRPLAGVHVFALPKPASGAIAPPYADSATNRSAATDRQGRYRLAGLPPGDYLLALVYGASTIAVGQSGSAIVKPGVGSGASFYPGAGEPQVFRLTGGEDLRNLNFTVGQSVLFTVSGKVELPSANAGVWLALTPVSRSTLATAVTQAERDGAFRFEGIPAGQYTLFAAGPSQGRNGMGAFLDAKARFSRTTLAVTGQNVEGLNLSLEEGRTAIVSLVGSCPAASVKIMLAPLEDFAAIIGTNADIAPGQDHKFENLAPARYQVKVGGDAPVCFSDAVPVLDLTGNAATAKITLSPAGSIHGTLTGALADTAVTLIGDDRVQVALSDGQGHFAFTDLPSGPYSLRAGKAAPTAIGVRSGAVTIVEITTAAITTVESKGDRQ
jgi:hypothetical protein